MPEVQLMKLKLFFENIFPAIASPGVRELLSQMALKLFPVQVNLQLCLSEPIESTALSDLNNGCCFMVFGFGASIAERACAVRIIADSSGTLKQENDMLDVPVHVLDLKK